MKNCPSHDDLSDLVDGSLPLTTRLTIRLHTLRCAACAAILAQERHLRAATRIYQANSHAPARLRAPVLMALAAEPIAVRRFGRFSKMATIATLATAIAIVAIGQWRTPGRGELAYAAVEKSMGEVRTARWIEHFANFDVATGKTLRFTEECAARMEPPAIRRKIAGGTAQILRPEMLSIRPNTVGYSTFVGPDWAGFFSVERKPVPTASAVLRKHILSQLMVPEPPTNVRRVSWSSRKVILDGRALWRFDLGLGHGGQLERDQAALSGLESSVADERLTQPGFRSTLWVNPDTHRVVRSAHEYYDGNKHYLVISDGFVYDETLPTVLFQPDYSRWPYSNRK